MPPPDDLYLANRDSIERAIQAACRRHQLRGADAQDFASVARIHLLDNDQAVLQTFQGRSSLQTYLMTVLTRCFLDWRNARWGKWRPSAEARRMGPLAVRLDTLVSRDGLTIDQASETLGADPDVQQSREALRQMAGRLPRRTRRTFLADDALENRPAPGGQPDAPLARAEAADAARLAWRLIGQGIGKLAPQDRLIVKMRFEDGFAVADIARALGIEQKPLYRRLGRLLADLRKALEEAGITVTVAAEVLDRQAFDLLQRAGEEEIGKRVRPILDDQGRFPVQDSRIP